MKVGREVRVVGTPRAGWAWTLRGWHLSMAGAGSPRGKITRWRHMPGEVLARSHAWVGCSFPRMRATVDTNQASYASAEGALPPLGRASSSTSSISGSEEITQQLSPRSGCRAIHATASAQRTWRGLRAEKGAGEGCGLRRVDGEGRGLRGEGAKSEG